MVITQQSQDLKKAGDGVRGWAVFLVFEDFFSHTGIGAADMTCTN